MNLLDSEKALYERFWCLLRDRQLMQIFEYYGPEAFRRSSVLEGFEAFIQAQGLRGKTCVEIGTLKGLTAIVLARYFERVISIDIVDDPLKWVFLEKLNINNVTYINVDSNAEKALIIANLDFDAAYVDGNHHVDTPSDFECVKRCGRVMFHEFWKAQPAVLDLVHSLKGVSTTGKFALWTKPPE